MNRILEMLHGARKIEWLLLALFAAILILFLADYRGVEQETKLEKRLENILSEVDGAGNVEVMVVQGENDVAEGVLIVTDASGIDTYLRIQHAVHTLLGLEISRIEIVHR